MRIGELTTSEGPYTRYFFVGNMGKIVPQVKKLCIFFLKVFTVSKNMNFLCNFIREKFRLYRYIFNQGKNYFHTRRK